MVRSMAIVALALASTACAQSPVPALTPMPTLAQGDELIREIDDPHTGVRWLLIRNDANPGGPGRFALVSAGQSATGDGPVRPTNSAKEAPPHPVIRAGDRLVVEEHTAIADAALEARALGPAALGSAFKVRLTIGGRVVRAVALGSGRAVLQPETGVRP